MSKKLKALDEHNAERISHTTQTSMWGNPTPNGIACPNCWEELYDSQPNVTLTPHPAQKNVHCEGCGYKGYRLA
jgi:hypothetical protein